MIIEKFASLPPWIHYEGINFQLQLFTNWIPCDVRLCYSIADIDDDSPHKIHYEVAGTWINPFADDASQGFLLLYENINTDEDFLSAATDCMKKLISFGLVEA